MEEVVQARGHEHVTATHGSTLEITSDDWLTPAGDCIIGIEADRTPVDFAPSFVAACQDSDARIQAQLTVTPEESADRSSRLTTAIVGRGDPDLSFESERSMVCRTSGHVDDRTIMVGADRAAEDLDRSIVSALAAGGTLELRLRVVD